MKALSLDGQRFGRLTVLRRVGSSPHGVSLWACACDCGSMKTADARSLRSGACSSCGCLRVETARKNGALFDGEAHKTHGMAAEPEYFVWKAMKQRCSPKGNTYDRECYYDRGIRVCARWRASFADFIADMGRRPDATSSIERINNDLGYEPSNCRWATPVEQANNRRPRRTKEVSK